MRDTVPSTTLELDRLITPKFILLAHCNYFHCDRFAFRELDRNASADFGFYTRPIGDGAMGTGTFLEELVERCTDPSSESGRLTIEGYLARALCKELSTKLAQCLDWKKRQETPLWEEGSSHPDD